jgi:ATP-dependent Clp protease ATP-binding subunit ClpA
VQKEIGDRLAVLILANEVEDGQEVLVSVADGGNELRVEPVVAS